jgi:hypothetical protein
MLLFNYIKKKIKIKSSQMGQTQKNIFKNNSVSVFQIHFRTTSIRAPLRSFSSVADAILFRLTDEFFPVLILLSFRFLIFLSPIESFKILFLVILQT